MLPQSLEGSAAIRTLYAHCNGSAQLQTSFVERSGRRADVHKKPTVDWTVRIDQLSRLRDLALMIAGTCYVSGYLARAFHAWEYDLGVIPGLQFEYFVAGLLLLAPLGAVYFVGLAIWKLLKKLGAWAAAAERRQKRIKTAFSTLIVVGALGLILGDHFPGSNIAQAGVWTFTSAFFLFMAYLSAADDDSWRGPARKLSPATAGSSLPVRILTRIASGLGHALTGILALNVLIFALALLIVVLVTGPLTLEQIPQEFGGVKPKCAQLDLVRKEFSPSVYAALADDPASSDDVVTSKRLEIYATGDPWVIKLPRHAGAPQNPTFRLDKDSVRAVSWCGSGT
jgi:hypothetical protein